MNFSLEITPEQRLELMTRQETLTKVLAEIQKIQQDGDEQRRREYNPGSQLISAARAEFERRRGPDYRSASAVGDREPPLDYRR